MTDTDISPTISGLQLMLDQYSGKTPYVGYPKALQDGIATLRALSAALTKSRAETAAAFELAAMIADKMAASAKSRIADRSPSDAEKVWGMFGSAEAIAANIRDLATPDQSSALAAVEAAAEARGMRKAIECCQPIIDGAKAYNIPQMAAGAIACHKAILAASSHGDAPND